MTFQRTLKGKISLSGIALHSGRTVQLTLKPAKPGHGITFVRTDLKNAAPISAHYKNVINTQMATVIANSGNHEAKVSTVEHLLAAFQVLGVDNAIVEVDGPEIPILDGSSLEFCKAIEEMGLQTQLQPRAFLQLRRRVELKIAEKWAVAEPSSRLEIHETVEWDHPVIGFQEFHYVEGRTSYKELASARTFGFLRDVENLKRMGLAQGGSLDNAVVLSDTAVLNPDGLRFPDEFVRHKVLDALGDFKLAGINMHAYVRLHRAGHDLHSQLLSAIFQDADNYEIVNGGVQEEKVLPQIRAALARAFA
jgi:UDP-3-O-[3-hydroxymyristoyl] N-acetylglucosamine deacetylase